MIKLGPQGKKITPSAFNARDLLDVTFWHSSLSSILTLTKAFGIGYLHPDDRDLEKCSYLSKFLNVFVQVAKCICPSFLRKALVIGYLLAADPNDRDLAN